MAWALANNTIAAGNSTATPSLTITEPAQNSLMVCAIIARDAANAVDPAVSSFTGWTLVPNCSVQHSAGADFSAFLYYRIAPASYGTTMGDLTLDRSCNSILAYANFTGNDTDQTGLQGAGDESSTTVNSVAVGPITPTEGTELVFYVAAIHVNATSTSPVVSWSAGTQIDELVNSSFNTLSTAYQVATDTSAYSSTASWTPTRQCIELVGTFMAPTATTYALEVDANNTIIENQTLTGKDVGCIVRGNDVVIRNCTIHSNTTDGLQIEGTGCIVYDNIIRDNTGKGILVNSGATTHEIYHNVIHNNGGIGIDADETGTIRNNIFRANTGDDLNVADGKTTTGGGNVLEDASVNTNTTGTYTDHGTYTTFYSQDPLFTDEASDDFTLQSGSAVLQGGVDVTAQHAGLTTDRAGASRPRDAASEPGAYEFAGVGSTPTGSGISLKLIIRT